MRVIHVTPYFAPAFVYGGPPRSIFGLCRALVGAGVDVEVFTTTADGDTELPPAVTDWPEYDGVPVRYFQRTSRALFAAPALAPALRDALPACDVVHIHGLWNQTTWDAAREARRAGVPYVVSTRGMLEPAALAHHAWRKRFAWALFDRRTIEHASLLHATSAVEEASLRARFPGAAIETLPNGVDLPGRLSHASTPLRASLDLPPGVPLVLFLGRLHPIKRLDIIADAFSRLLASHPEAHLVIAGPDERDHRRTIEPLFAPFEDHVTWTGPVDDDRKRALVATSSMLVMCSESESFGMSVVEAMAAAIPVVVTRTCPWVEVAQHDAGYWVDQRADAVEEAMRRLIENPAGARAKGERGRALVASRYTWDAIARSFTRCYEASIAAVRTQCGPQASTGRSGREASRP